MLVSFLMLGCGTQYPGSMDIAIRVLVGLGVDADEDGRDDLDHAEDHEDAGSDGDGVSGDEQRRSA
jgi:hypothetical protein